MTFYEFTTADECPIISEFAQDFAEITFGIANTFSSFREFMGPMIIGWVLIKCIKKLIKIKNLNFIFILFFSVIQEVNGILPSL